MTKALVLARAFHAAGHRVILGDTARYRMTAHRFSRAVSGFVVMPEADAPDYAERLAEIVRAHGVDTYVPVCAPATSLRDAEARARLDPLCEVVHLDAEQIGRVDDKHRFAEAARAAGLDAPKSVRITDPAQVEAYDFSGETRPFVLKSIDYDALRRLDLTPLPRPTPEETRAYVRSLPISEARPWVMQAFIPGREFCTHGTFRNGRLTLRCACASSPFQVDYDGLDRPDVRDWIERFAAAYPATGQLSFDFIEAGDDGALYAIECNPRTHSAITLFDGDPGLAETYLSGGSGAPMEPRADARPTYWIGHELFRLALALRPGRGWRARAGARLSVLARGRDAVLSARDPLPFLLLHQLHIPALLARELWEGRGWHRVDFNIGKLVPAGGD